MTPVPILQIVFGGVQPCEIERGTALCKAAMKFHICSCYFCTCSPQYPYRQYSKKLEQYPENAFGIWQVLAGIVWRQRHRPNRHIQDHQ